MSYNSDLEQIRKKAELQGWRYQRTASGHHQFYSPDKESIVTTSGTPSDQRGWLNFLAEMKRGGYQDDFGPFKATIKALVENKEVETAPLPPPPPTIGAESVRKELSLSTAVQVRSLLKSNPGQVFSIDEVFEKIKVVSKKANRTNVVQALKGAVDKKLAHRVGESPRSGLYKWGQPEKVKKEKAHVAEPAAPAASGDLSADLKEIDEALAALAKAAKALTKSKERLAAMAELKKLLRF